MTNSIKFYYNGLRLNGEKSLVKCSYSLGDNYVTIYANGYSHLPRDLFDVVNETDLYTDYFEDDRATLGPDHPLYKYARYAAAKAELRHLPRHIKYLEESVSWYPEGRKAEIEAKKARLAELEAIENPGHPKASDLEAIYVMRLEAENARKAAEHEAQLKAREEALRKRNEGRAYIEEIANEYPIKEGEPVVTINWSEHPAFYSWKENELKLSVAAAEIILTHFDKEVHAEQDRGYDKTSFTIEYLDENGELSTYEGRYDLGDNDGGLIEHIRAFGRWYVEKGYYGNGIVSDEARKDGEEIMAIADMLEGYTASAQIVSISLAPWVENLLKAKENTDKIEFALLMHQVNSMSDEDLAAAIMRIDPEDEEKELVAEFFVKQLALRDIGKALEVYKQWKNQ